MPWTYSSGIGSQTGGQDHTLNHVAVAMEFKREAVIQYFRFGKLALAKPTDWSSEIKTFEYNLVIDAGRDFALVQNQPRFSCDQTQSNGVAGETRGQIENQRLGASDHRDVQGRSTFRRIVRNLDVDTFMMHFSEVPAVFRFLSSAVDFTRAP